MKVFAGGLRPEQFREVERYLSNEPFDFVYGTSQESAQLWKRRAIGADFAVVIKFCSHKHLYSLTEARVPLLMLNGTNVQRLVDFIRAEALRRSS